MTTQQHAYGWEATRPTHRPTPLVVIQAQDALAEAQKEWDAAIDAYYTNPTEDNRAAMEEAQDKYFASNYHLLDVRRGS